MRGSIAISFYTSPAQKQFIIGLIEDALEQEEEDTAEQPETEESDEPDMDAEEE